MSPSTNKAVRVTHQLKTPTMNCPKEFLEIEAGRWKSRIASLSAEEAQELALRAQTAPLFAHAYSFHLNFRFGGMKPIDLLDIAAQHGMKGVKIHVEDGEEYSLLASPQDREAFGARARELGLIVHIETSETTREAMVDAIEIARTTGGVSVRCYPRYEATVSQIISKTIADLKLLWDLDPNGKLIFTLEQHEDLTSDELVRIIEEVANPHLSLLFDFGNMINAFERPLKALQKQSAYITEVHIKDCYVIPDRGGWAQTGTASGTGHLPFTDMLLDLLLLGEHEPQVTAFSLEEEAEYFAPAMRFPDEGNDPFIAHRTASLTPVNTDEIDQRLEKERKEATAQIDFVRGLLFDIEKRALASANQASGDDL